MNHLLIAILTLPYFCVTPGAKLEYQRFDGKNPEKIWWNQTTVIDSTRTLQDGTLEVFFTATIKSIKEKSPVKVEKHLGKKGGRKETCAAHLRCC